METRAGQCTREHILLLHANTNTEPGEAISILTLITPNHQQMVTADVVQWIVTPLTSDKGPNLVENIGKICLFTNRP